MAPLHAAVFAKSDVASSVLERLISIVVIGKQSLLELALILKDFLKNP